MERDVGVVLTPVTASPGHHGWTLGRLAIFPAGCDLTAAEAVATVTMDDLTSLATAGLPRREAGDRLVLYDLIRASRNGD
jgi:hypothetical protein